MTADCLELLVAKAALGLVLRDDLPQAAAQVLEAGHDSRSLRVLAGLTRTELGEAPALLDRALDELKLLPMGQAEAVRRLARAAAEEIVSGNSSPYDGARQIWSLTLLLPEVRFSDLDSFVYAASEWEDRPEARHTFELGVLAAARDLISETCPQRVPPDSVGTMPGAKR